MIKVKRRKASLMRLERQIRVQQGRLWMKRLFLLVFVAIWVLGMLGLLLLMGSPNDWQTAEIRFSHMTQQRVHRGGTQHYLYSTDGRVFVLPDAETVVPKLRMGEVCRIVFSDPFFRNRCIEGLETDEDGVLIALEARIARHRRDQRDCWLCIAGALGIYAVYLVLMELFGCRKEKAAIRMLRQELAQQEARKIKRHRKEPEA